MLNEDLSAGNQFTWSGLDDGMYVLTETKTPNDYKGIDPIPFEVKASHMVVIENLSPDAAVRKQVLDSLTGQTTGSLDLQADADLTGLFANVKNEPALLRLKGRSR